MDDLLQKLVTNLQILNIDQLSDEFSDSENDFERFDYAYTILKDHLLPSTSFKINTNEKKNASESDSFRKKGNLALQKKEYLDALNLYSQSVAFAPHESNSEELSLALGNRSVVLFLLKKYDLALKDIDLAIKHHYPLNLKYKIFERKGRILQFQGDKEAAITYFKLALEMVKNSNLPSDKRLQFECEVKNLMEENTTPVLPENEKKCLPNKSYGQHPLIFSSSDSIQLAFNEEYGRQLIATRDIQPGDVLIVEKPFSSIILHEYIYTHCSNCLKRNFSLNPCPYCSSAMFCSDECFDIAWNTSHKIECELLPLFKSLNISKLQHLSIRVVLNASRCGENFNELQLKLLKETLDDNIHNLGFDSQYDSEDYSTIYDLIANSEKRTLNDLFRRAIYAGIFVEYLEKNTTFFKTKNDSLKLVMKKFLGGLILRHLQNLPCNAHEISELVIKYDIAKNCNLEMLEIGAGAYATLSLLNHSCNPNVSRFCYDGNICVLKAVRSIKKGEELLDNYGHHFAIEVLKDRREFLNEQYFFSCQCEACLSNWPLYDHLSSDEPPQYKCAMCSNKLNVRNNSTKVTCLCGKETNLLSVKKQIENSTKVYKHIFDDILSGKENENYQAVIDHLILLEKHYMLPWKEFNDCQELLKHIFNTKGNCFKGF